METNNKNKFIVVSYALYDVTKGDNGEEMLIERTTDERPFIFISGMGVTLPAFEEKVVDLAKGEEFDFQLDPDSWSNTVAGELTIPLSFCDPQLLFQ